MFEKYLQQIGLSEKEAEIYVALLQSDNASVNDLAQKTKVNRTTIYPVLETLAQKGLVSEIQIDKKTHYQAEPPERLETFVERQKIVLEESSRRLADVIPQLKTIQREAGERPVVKYFEGREGIISSLEDFFETKDSGGEAYFVYPKDLLNEIFTKQEKDYYRSTRLKRNIKSKAIYTFKGGEIPSSIDGDRIKVDGGKYPITCDISIYKNRVRINMLSERLAGISITSKDFAETLKSLFLLAFNKTSKT